MATQAFLEKCYKDKEGKNTLVQIPNTPLITWFISMVLAKLISAGTLHQILSIISFGTLFTWAWLELFSGSSYLRRLLGPLILVGLIHSRFSSF